MAEQAAEPAGPAQAAQPAAPANDHFFLGHLKSVHGAEWYYNQRFLGRGGNGTAFLVTCSSGPNYGMQFVLKVFHKISEPIRRQAFLDEIGHLRAIDHPGITRIFDEGTFTAQGNSYPFAVIEYVPLTARELLVSKEINRLRAIRIAFNCLSALDRLHRAVPPLIHRDLKPENILISDMGAKLADFGLVKVLDDLGDGAEEVDAIDGTQWPGMPWRYRTPELVQRANDGVTAITTASDIFQFGTVFYELLTGFNPQKRPASVTEPIELNVRNIRGTHGPRLDVLLGGMLAHAPDQRPTALQCLRRLNLVHRAYCGELLELTGEHV
jgi:serine/threonine protein kinase